MAASSRWLAAYDARAAVALSSDRLHHDHAAPDVLGIYDLAHCTTLYGGDGHGHGGAVASPPSLRVTVTVASVVKNGDRHQSIIQRQLWSCLARRWGRFLFSKS
ncbi:hypothetical protein B0H13DRAFT_2331762 [Mycena leptocephala]|nr:hypothetical protein B0H13DRAFT_2331762 [Mycena leptocephala]